MQPIEIISGLQKKEFEAYYVGGCVRDMLMGLKPKDFDIVTSASTDEIMDIFKTENIKEVGKNFGVILVNNIEVATFRSDKYFGGGDKDCKNHILNVGPLLDPESSLSQFLLTMRAMRHIDDGTDDTTANLDIKREGLCEKEEDPKKEEDSEKDEDEDLQEVD